MATESWSVEGTGINQLHHHDHSFNWFYWSAVGNPGRKSAGPLFGSCSATLHCLSFHPCVLPQLHISRGVKGSWTKLKVCTYLPGAALRITGSRQESDLSLQFSACWRINKNIFVSVWATELHSAQAFGCSRESYSDVYSSHDLSTQHSSLQTTGTRGNRHFWASSIC